MSIHNIESEIYVYLLELLEQQKRLYTKDFFTRIEI